MREKNPFKFGSIVEEPYFTNRLEEIRKVKSILDSENHLIIVSPRRYGKTSLVNKVILEMKREYILLDLQLITSPLDFAEQLLKRLYRIYPFERIRQYIKSFRVIPSVSINPVSGETDISFRNVSISSVPLEDVFTLIEKLSPKKKKLIIVLDEFQEIRRIGENLDRKLRSILQYHKTVNYLFLGSQESLMRDLFEKKKSPFYHFGYLLPLERIRYDDFYRFLVDRFKSISERNEQIAEKVLAITHSHPYYTQQLAFTVWNIVNENPDYEEPVKLAVSELVTNHDVDYERLWNTLISTDRKILIGLSLSNDSPLSEEFGIQYDIGAVSTVYSGLKRLIQQGYVIKDESGYEIDDPFFKCWIVERRRR